MVPEILPLDGLRTSPSGRLAKLDECDQENVYGGVPPEAARVHPEKAVNCVPVIVEVQVPAVRVRVAVVVNVAVTVQFADGMVPVSGLVPVSPQVFVKLDKVLPEAAVAVQEIAVPAPQVPAQFDDPEIVPEPEPEVDVVIVNVGVLLELTTKAPAVASK